MNRFVLVVAAVAQVAALATTAESQAWLRAHDNPSTDELAELKTENPEAYGIVKALLTKRSLGLLDPKHPSASFSAKPAALSADVRGPDAFAKFASTPTQNSETFTEAPVAQQHQDFFNWKPPQSGLDDDQAVKSVLGEVAVAMEKKPAAPLAAQPPVVQAAQVAPAAEENSYLKGFDLGDKAPVVESKPSDDNRYLRGSGLEASEPGHHPETPASPHQQDLLSTFSWGDEPAPQPQQRKTSLAVAASTVSVDSAGSAEVSKTKSKPAGNLFAWLDGKAAVASKPIAKVAVTNAAPANKYMMDLE